MVEGEYTTLVVPPGLKFTIDEHGLGNSGKIVRVTGQETRRTMPIPTLAEKLRG